LAHFDWKEDLGMGQAYGSSFNPFRNAIEIFNTLINYSQYRILLVFTGFDVLAAKLKRHSFRVLYGFRLDDYTLTNEQDPFEVADFLISRFFERFTDRVETAILDPASQNFAEQ
jgi:hypothetical protein